MSATTSMAAARPMDPKAAAVAEACTAGSDGETMSFPEVVGALMAAGFERYHTDLVRAEKTYYQPDGTSHLSAAAPVDGSFAVDFDAAGVEAAVRAIQARRIGYRRFCVDIAAAGCVGYHVSLAGRRAVYYGRSGESWVEPFPPAR
jgi:uncharacterized protein YbcV (DUF1398 family)